MTQFDHTRFLKDLTRQPGVYQMYDVDGAVLYVGKAKNLKNRVSSYFRQSGLTVKTEALVRKIHSIEITVTGSEAQALVLEQSLIKAQRPPYNILLRDDKSYPYIFLSQEEFPRLALHRGTKKAKGRYFGPFPNAHAVRESLQFLQKTFRVRQCEDSVFRNRSRPCLQYQIGRCTGPCVALVSKQDYGNDVRHTEMFLEGHSDTLNAELAEQMNVAAEHLEFERAAELRDQIAHLRQIQMQNSVENSTGEADIVACACESGEVCVHILFIRQGRVLGSKSFFPKDALGLTESQVLEQFLPQLYLGGRAMDTPAEIVVSHAVEGADAIIEAIRLVAGRAIELNDSVRTHRARWLAMAIEAARQNLRMRIGSRQSIVKKCEALQERLGLDDLPERIECFDISHSSGESTVASCVVFNAEGPVKSSYRRFNIDGITAGDDYAAMAQAIQRRYRRLQEEGSDLPDLLLIDGGRGQVNKAREVLNELGVVDVMMVGVAKGTTRKPGFETLVLPDGVERVLSSDDPALHFIQLVRDEAHRFAITGHKQARDKKRRRSTLEDIAGVGPKRRRELLNYFGGLQEVAKASTEDIAKVPGFSKKLAQEVYSTLHSE